MGLRSVHPPVDICIVTQMHPSSNPRVVKEADALTATGYNVAVIAPDYSVWGREADKEFDGRAWRIVERPQFGPLSPRVTRVAELTRRAVAGALAGRLGVQVPAVVCAAWHPAAPQLVKAAKRQKAKLYIAHYPAALPAAAIAAQLYGAVYAYDAEDFHPGDLPDLPQHTAENRMVRLIECRHLPGCAFVTAASPGIAEAYAAEYGISRPTSILNTFPKELAPTTWTPSGSAESSPSIYWFSQTIGGDRGLQSAVRAISLSKCKPHLYLRGEPAKGVVEELHAIAADNGVSDHVHLLPMAPPNQMEALAARYDIGLCGEIGHTPNRRIALTNKQFTYLLAGIPVLMSNIPAHEAFASEAGGAIMLYQTDDANSLADAMDAVLGQPNRLIAMRERAWTLGQTRFNWEVEQRLLIEQVERMLGPGLPRTSVLQSNGARPGSLSAGWQ
jgi:glycosyltransferase involved in cell wall biosynthesis